jgi:hypothetical protein
MRTPMKPGMPQCAPMQVHAGPADGCWAAMTGPHGHCATGHGTLSFSRELGCEEVSARGAVGFINPLIISEISLNLFQTSNFLIKFNSCQKFMKLVPLFF